MATSLEERLKLKQYQVDTWTTREQLCLASAVMRSGDQNWVAVRRNIKMLTNETSRPPDWYSTKNCALQYAKLLECVDTPKRKRERGDASNETPGEIVTKMLSKQRVEELRAAEGEEREEYNKLRREIQQLEDGLLDSQLDAFWEELQKERAEQEEEERKHQQWLKEREEKITAIQQALKHQGPKVPVLPNKKKQKLQWPSCSGGLSTGRRNSGVSETSSEIDSAVDSPDINETMPESPAPEESVSQEPEPKPTPPSPLLSSLLSKSPVTSVSGASTSPLPQLNLGSKGPRGSGVSPVSVALQNLVNSAISGTEVNKDHSAKTSRSPSLSGSSTLSRLLDLPPSTPTTVLPRLPDVSGPAAESKEEENKGDSATQKCEEEKKDEDSKDCPNVEESSEKEKKLKTDEVPPKEDDATEAMEVDESKEGKVEEIKVETQAEESKVEQELQEEPSEKAEKIETLKEEKEKVETKETEDVMETQLMVQEKAEEKVKEAEDVKGDISLEEEGGEKKTDEKPDKEADGKDIKKKEQKHDKFDELMKEKDKKKKEEKYPKQEEPNKEKEKEKEKKVDASIVKKSDESKPPKGEDKEVKEEKPPVGETEKKKESKKSDETKPKEKKKEDEKPSSKKKSEEEEERANKKKKTEDEEEKPSKSKPSEEQKPAVKKPGEEESKEVETESDKKKNKSQKKEQEEDSQDGQESKDWMSEVERIFVRNTKRKVSGGDFAGSSSPLITESAPNSPASTHYGDDPEHERSYRSWKKPIMILWNEIAAHKFASLFLRPITDDQAPGYHSVVYRPMDLQTIKRHIESGVIRNTAEFQRDMMLMFLNAKMYNTSDHNVYHMAHQMMKDTVSTIEEFLNTQMLARAEETPQKSLRRETRESSAKRSDDDPKRKSRDSLDEKSFKKRRL
ncbi:bromodomain-containing protein 8-like isoform X4 [Penaeus japonicus]|uniref:bromodomain-containing protein 8-like isoform X4 n=1 Tax=Penaeus japonicus TaxID=27405 RepID=UPI001C716E54|nr:bromodomain-containing protein 8-like isoform X4 [Penaeus japonicus]